jgi:RNA polymerase sigma-70 factor (ECF subfamily)
MNGGDEGSNAAGSTHEAFCGRNRYDLLALAWALSGDRPKAAMLVDDALAEAGRSWRKIGRYDDPDAWVRWVVARRSTARVGRKWPRRRAGAGPNVGRSRLGEAPALDPGEERFWREVRALPARRARCVALAYLGDLEPSGVARVIGCTVSTARHHLHQGRLTLAGCRWPHQGRPGDDATVLARVDEQGRRAAAALRATVAVASGTPALVGSAAAGSAA